MRQDGQGGYTINIGSSTWLKSAPSFVTANKKLYKADPNASDKLIVSSTGETYGHDNAGIWNATYTTYRLGTSDIYLRFVIKQYDSFIVFDQVCCLQE